MISAILFPIGASLMQAILSPQEAADLLFYLMNVMSTVSASTTTASTAPISSFIDEASTLDMVLAQLTSLKSDTETITSEVRQRKSGARNSTKRK